MRQLDLPVYLHTDLAGTLADVGKHACVREFVDGQAFALDDLQIRPFAITHDALAPVGFTLCSEEGKIGVATDLGVVTRLVAECLVDCRVLVIETNHDEDMLRDGPYPWKLKQRVRSHHGHLSNVAGSGLLHDLVWPGLEAVFLGHLSETNNTPELALESAKRVLDHQQLCLPNLLVGKQAQPVVWAA